jgi:WD40 repeat protein
MITERKVHRPFSGLLALALMVSACRVAPTPYPAAPDPAEVMSRAMASVKDRFGGDVQSQSAQTNDGVQVVMQSGHAQDISQTSMSPDGREILTGSRDGTVKQWDVASGQELRTFSGFSLGMMQQVTFSADGRVVVISDGLQTYLFDHVTGQKLQTLEGGSMGSFSAFGGTTRVAASGRYAATGYRRAATLRPYR